MNKTTHAPKVVSRQESIVSPWMSLVTRSIVFPERNEILDFHAVRQADYVNVLAVTADQKIPLVKQYRPTLERFTLELPGGLRDHDESPLTTATRELFEETGLQPFEPLTALGEFAPDAGRLENRLWGFFGRVDSKVSESWTQEVGIEVIFVSKKELYELVTAGKIENALHLALIGMAVISNKFHWEN